MHDSCKLHVCSNVMIWECRAQICLAYRHSGLCRKHTLKSDFTPSLTLFLILTLKLISSTKFYCQTLIPPSHLFGISRNQEEPAGMRNFQNLCYIREGSLNPSHTRGGMSRNDVGREILCIFLDMRFGSVLNYVRTHLRANPNRDVPTAFEWHSSGNQKIPTAFKLHSS